MRRKVLGAALACLAFASAGAQQSPPPPAATAATVASLKAMGDRAEIERWNRMLTAPEPRFNTAPNAFLVSVTTGLKPGRSDRPELRRRPRVRGAGDARAPSWWDGRRGGFPPRCHEDGIHRRRGGLRYQRVPHLFPGLRVVRYEEPIARADYGGGETRVVRLAAVKP